MPAQKLQNEQEFRRWWAEDKPYQWMIDEYMRKYGIEIVPSTIGNWRARLGLPRRQARDLDLVPWSVKSEHQRKYVLTMLRAEGRRRSGAPLPPLQKARLDNWLKFMQEEGCVVHYDPDTEEGFFYVHPRPGKDRDLIREPDKRTRQRGMRE